MKSGCGEVEVDGWMMKGVNFEVWKKYGVMMDVYGEGGGCRVEDVWEGGDVWDEYVGNEGYIVVRMEKGGGGGGGGGEWRKCMYGEVGRFGWEDEGEGIVDLGGEYWFIDSWGIGIRGWSGGGRERLKWMLGYGDVFWRGIGIGLVWEEGVYDRIYEEG